MFEMTYLYTYRYERLISGTPPRHTMLIAATHATVAPHTNTHTHNTCNTHTHTHTTLAHAHTTLAIHKHAHPHNNCYIGGSQEREGKNSGREVERKNGRTEGREAVREQGETRHGVHSSHMCQPFSLNHIHLFIFA